MFRRILNLPASHSNPWLVRGYSSYKAQYNSNNYTTYSCNMTSGFTDSYGINPDDNKIRPYAFSRHTSISNNDPEIQNALAGIDFSSSFSDDTMIKQEEHQIIDEDIDLSVTFSDDEALLQMLGTRTKKNVPHLAEEALDCDDNGASNILHVKHEKIGLSPILSNTNILDASSPKHKKAKSELWTDNSNHANKEYGTPANVVIDFTDKKELFQSPINQKRTFSTSSTKSKKLENIYPTIQLATQKAFTIEDERNNKVNKPATENVKNVKPIILSGEQEYVLQLARKGQSLFYTGSAGTGKSVLLRSIIKSLKHKYEKGNVAVTASTGLAACNIGGITLHSFAGVGLGDGNISALMKKIRRNKKAYTRWCLVKVLIIDEISMIDGVFLNKLDSIAKKLRKNNRPFGGIQLIVCGDFYQLPPVSKARPSNQVTAHNSHDSEEESIFAFESQAWKDAIKCTIILKEVFRQRGDQTFIDMLNDMRNGKVNNETIMEFRRLSRKLDNPDGIEPAELFSTRYEVENANNTRLNLLKGETQVFKAIDSGSLPIDQRQSVLNNFLAPQKLFLKKNAQVMCIKNFDETLVNGSLGQVVNFMDRDTYMHYNLMKENPEASVDEIEHQFKKIKESDKLNSDELEAELYKPLSLNDSIFDFLEDIPEMGLHDVELDVQELAFKTNKDRKIAFIKSLHEKSSKLKYPLVRFLLPDGYNTREVLVEPEQWTVEDENENVLARRVQLPLILAWSLSIHKSQGQTLPKVKVDLKRVFEKGQAYVALSRAVSRSGLQVLNFNKDKIMAHPKVNKFYDSLMSTEELALIPNTTSELNLISIEEKHRIQAASIH